MIPAASITAWRQVVPWSDDAQLEQDLILSRALIELYRRPCIAEQAAFRGGTALHKLYFDPPGRYSEDIDLVQVHAGPIGPLVGEIRSILDPWLGTPNYKQGHGRFTLYYRFETTLEPVRQMRLKIEINTREHFDVHGIVSQPLMVSTPWFTGEARVSTYSLPELLATKLHALYQRRKGRDLLDLQLGLEHPDFDPTRLITAFERYMEFVGGSISRAQFEANMAEKIDHPQFLGDVLPLLRTGLRFDPITAWSRVHAELVTRLPGDPWKGSES